MMLKHLPALTAATMLALLVSACGNNDTADTAETADSASESGTAGPVLKVEPVREVTWASGSHVHVGDRTWELPGTPTALAATSDGVFAIIDHELVWSTPQDEQTLAKVGGWGGSPRISPEGRYLGYIDQASGPKDEFGTRVASAVVVDLTTGTEVLRSSEGLGDVESDLDALYPEVNPVFLGFDREAAYFGGGRTRRATLPEGPVVVQPEPNLEEEAPLPAWPGEEQFLPADTLGFPGWPFRRSTSSPDTFVTAATNKRVPLTVENYPTFGFGGWLDRTHAYGIFTRSSESDAPDPGPDTGVVVSCDLEAAACTPLSSHEVSAGEVVWGVAPGNPANQ